ncbi:MAG: recombinase family protein [Methylococcales bacterium]|nr:recombinase family protein [Methylococcales bacterium]
MNGIQYKGVARVYIRVSTQEQDITRQEALAQNARDQGYHVAGTYKEKASGARLDRPELLRLINELQPGEVVIAEHIDRISRLPLPDAIKLIDSIQAKGAKLIIPGLVDLSKYAESSDGVTQIVLLAMQELLLNIALQFARDDYENRRERQRQGIRKARLIGKFKGRRPDIEMHKRIIAYRKLKHSITDTANTLKCSKATVKTVWRKYKMVAADGAAAFEHDLKTCTITPCPHPKNTEEFEYWTEAYRCAAIGGMNRMVQHETNLVGLPRAASGEDTPP